MYTVFRSGGFSAEDKVLAAESEKALTGGESLFRFYYGRSSLKPSPCTSVESVT